MFNNNRNNFGDLPSPPPPPDASFGMPWGGSNQIMPHMMPPMMPHLMAGMMPAYSYPSSNDQNHNFNAPMMMPHPPLPMAETSLNMESVIPNKGPIIGPILPAVGQPVAQQTNSAPPLTDKINATTNASTSSETKPAVSKLAKESQKRTRSRSPKKRRGTSHDRKDDSNDNRGRRDGESSSYRRGEDRRRSRSRDHRRRDRSDRRTKWDTAEKESGRNVHGTTGNHGAMMVSREGGITTGTIFPGAMYPANMEMMGQAQLEMMKGQQMGAMTPMNPGMNCTMMGGGMMMDASAMNVQSQMFPHMFNRNLVLREGTLEPPYPGAPLPPQRARPPGCRTIFVGGLPEAVHEQTIEEIFERFGHISSKRLKKGFCHVRFDHENSVEASFCLNGYRLILKDATDEIAVSSGLLIDYALNRDDQHDHEKRQHATRGPTPPRTEHISSISAVSEKIKSDEKFAEALPTLIAWLEGGECSKKNANTFYAMIQATNNHTRRLMNDKMVFDEEAQEMKDKMKGKAVKIITQLEQVVKVLNAANHKRVWDHFTKMQRKNVETWYKMSEELLTVKDEFNQFFNEDDVDSTQKKIKTEEMYNEIKAENENLLFELEACKNEVHVAKTEAAREFEKFKAHFIAEQALLSTKSGPKMPMVRISPLKPPPPPPPIHEEDKLKPHGASVNAGEARLISVISMFLLVHPLGASLDYIFSYVRSLCPDTTQTALHSVLQKHGDVFTRTTTGVGAHIEHRWSYIPFKLPVE